MRRGASTIYNKIQKIGISILFVVLILAICIYSVIHLNQNAIKNISVIVYGDTNERWSYLRSGVEQAAKDEGVECNFIISFDEYSIESQVLLMKREIESGADALLVACADRDKMNEYLEQYYFGVPILYIESGVGGDMKNALVSADNYEMGYRLGSKINNQEDKRSKIAILLDKEQRDSVYVRYNGVCSGLGLKKDNVVIWKRTEAEKEMSEKIFLQKKLAEEAVDIVVTLENSSTIAFTEVVIDLNKNVLIYSIANTEQAMYYLDHGVIKSLVYQNEYSVGYIGLRSLVHSMQESYSDYIEYRLVTRSNMYNSDIQKILFPFVK